jgi:hypothetical protein
MVALEDETDVLAIQSIAFLGVQIVYWVVEKVEVPFP